MADILSQEELDALLGEMQRDDDEDEGAGGDAPAPPAEAAGAEAAPAAEAPPEPRPEDPPAERQWSEDGRNVDLILTIPVELQVELGRTRMTIHELLQLGQGSVIELNRLASDLIDLSVNQKVVAQGEAVVVSENFGFRVVEVDSVRERIRKL